MKTVINIKADKDVKEQAVRTARDMGIPLSTVINAMLKRFVDEKTVTLVAPFRPSKRLEKVLQRVDRDIKTGRNLSRVFTTAEALMEDLRS
jgi:addiction module RelB/DinJ family antitoxin